MWIDGAWRKGEALSSAELEEQTEERERGGDE